MRQLLGPTARKVPELLPRRVQLRIALCELRLQGVHVMMTSAVLAFWSERLFPDIPSLSFTAALLASAAGSILGPATAGTLSDTFDPATMFLATATLPVATACILRDRHARERSVLPDTPEPYRYPQSQS